MSIQEAIDTIMAQIPGERRANTVDTVKSSDPKQPLKGIATTFLATVPVIRKAIAAGANLIITHEPTYYNHLDETKWLAGDPVFAYKQQLLEENQIVVWRFHDYWHQHQPDGILQGMLQKLGWETYIGETEKNILKLPETSLQALAKRLKKQLALTRTFLVGDPALRCSKVGLLPGSYGREPHIHLLQQDIEVLIVGEVAEWETCEYVRDAAAMGLNKGLIVLGHAESEEPGMAYLQQWLGKVLPDVSAIHIPATDPFQSV